MKTCTKCNEMKSLDMFHRNKAGTDGRYTICKTCRIPASRAYREQNGPALRQKWREAYAADPTKHRANASRYQRENWDDRKAYARAWTKNNKVKANAHTAARYAALQRATPPWITKDQRADMRWFYETARDLQWLSEEPLTVDHIEPLRGENSSGLHVPWNLQIISLSANSRKGNRLER